MKKVLTLFGAVTLSACGGAGVSGPDLPAGSAPESGAFVSASGLPARGTPRPGPTPPAFAPPFNPSPTPHPPRYPEPYCRIEARVTRIAPYTYVVFEMFWRNWSPLTGSSSWQRGSLEFANVSGVPLYPYSTSDYLAVITYDTPPYLNGHGALGLRVDNVNAHGSVSGRAIVYNSPETRNVVFCEQILPEVVY